MEKHPEKASCCKGKPIFGYFLIIIGAIFLIQLVFQIEILSRIPWDYVWPILSIIVGIHILYKHK